jgi:hypothetical protein
VAGGLCDAALKDLEGSEWSWLLQQLLHLPGGDPYSMRWPSDLRWRFKIDDLPLADSRSSSPTCKYVNALPLYPHACIWDLVLDWLPSRFELI